MGSAAIAAETAIRPIITALTFLGEKTPWNLAHFSVIGHTLAAQARLVAGTVSAGALGQIGLQIGASFFHFFIIGHESGSPVEKNDL
ncbi:MAG: hypothetical protein KQI62_19135 [Deltaproteobacteria bacterium]|nr:hypothetical protein [Deltaproteobacteria bacterium]